MNGPSLQRKVIITNRMGLHVRPAAACAKAAATFQSTITVAKGDRKANAKSILELLLLAAEQGSELVVEARGTDAAAAADAVVELLARSNWDAEPLPPKG
jgi:phosphotransferase system HPr (HPr) family protein